MAEPTDTQSRDWNSLPDVLLEQICSRMDLLSTVRLAACSVSLYRLLVCNRPALFKTPCLLMPDPRRWPRHRLDDPTEVAVVPLDMLPLPVHLSFMRGHYWAGMKANWIILIHHTGSPWRLVDIYTQREITLPSLDTAAIEPRGPPDTPAYYARDASSFWLDLCLQKVVICEVPTPSEDYMDYKLIALFNMGLVYLESGRHTWLWLIINPVEATFLSDAIVHDGIVYAVDAQIGCLYWWNLSSCNCSISSHLDLMNTTACSFVTNLECIACL